MSPGDAERRPPAGAAHSSAEQATATIPPGGDSAAVLALSSRRVSWKSIAAEVQVGRFPVVPAFLDLADVDVAVDGEVWSPNGRALVARAGALVTITGRLAEDTVLPLRRQS